MQLGLMAVGLLVVSMPSTKQVASDSSPAPAVGGVAFELHRVREVPWAVHVVRIDRSKSDFEFTTTLGDGDALGLSRMTDQIRMITSRWGRPVAAINGDFYRTENEPYSGDPRGLQILRGELVSAPTDRECFWIDTRGNPRMDEVKSEFAVTWPDGSKTAIGLNEERESNSAVLYTAAAGASTGASGGTEYVLEQVPGNPWVPLAPGLLYPARVAQIRGGGNTRLKYDTLVLSVGRFSRILPPRVAVGDIVKISTATTPDLRGVKTAIGGGPVLVRQGEARPGRVHKSMDRHPRSAIGWNQKEILFVVVDGRQHGWSVGMTLPELANFLVKLGCEEAVGLDGGGSAELWFSGRIKNRPCYGHERLTANTLVLVEKPPSEKPER